MLCRKATIKPRARASSSCWLSLSFFAECVVAKPQKSVYQANATCWWVATSAVFLALVWVSPLIIIKDVNLYTPDVWVKILKIMTKSIWFHKDNSTCPTGNQFKSGGNRKNVHSCFPLRTTLINTSGQSWRLTALHASSAASCTYATVLKISCRAV